MQLAGGRPNFVPAQPISCNRCRLSTGVVGGVSFTQFVRLVPSTASPSVPCIWEYLPCGGTVSPSNLTKKEREDKIYSH